MKEEQDPEGSKVEEISKSTRGGVNRRVRVLGAVALALVLVMATWWWTSGADQDGEEADRDVPVVTPTNSNPVAAALVKNLTLTAGEAQCVLDRSAGVLAEATLLDLLERPNPGTADQVALDRVLSGCSLKVTDQKRPDAAAGPFTFGDDPDLDLLWDACSADGKVCDELYNAAPEGSEYEAFADTCGGRGAPQVACAPDALAEGDPNPPTEGTGRTSEYGDDPGFDELWQQCDSGDIQSCRALAFQAPAESAYAEFGRTCGGKLDESTCTGAG